jgi:acyl-CoA reductase-like NAD-dependent aldehyde dehydrogenase
MAAQYFQYNAGWADKTSGEVVTAGPEAFDYTVHEPYGVVGAIIPWNASLIVASQVLAPILAGGNTVVLKPSDLSPFVTLRLVELALEAGVPPGVINVVTGDKIAGETLVRHKGVSKIHFTGSRETARKILAATAENIVPVCLELGGKSPLLIFSDSDLIAAAQVALGTIVGLSGQGCALPTRVLVDRAVHDKFLVLLKGLLRRVKVGDPLEKETQVGPLISAKACERVLAIIDRALHQHHGDLIAGGNRMDGVYANGYFIAPTIFTAVAEESELAGDEIFGPVLSVMSFEHEEDAIRMSNNSPYGLAAYVFTNDLKRAHRVSSALEVGTVWINGLDSLEPSMPFGGFKQSGYGRLGGRAGVREFTRQKNVWLSLSNSSLRDMR